MKTNYIAFIITTAWLIVSLPFILLLWVLGVDNPAKTIGNAANIMIWPDKFKK
jgi:hypothetical protein